MRGGGKEEEEISSEIERRTQKYHKEREDSGKLKRRENKNQKTSVSYERQRKIYYENVFGNIEKETKKGGQVVRKRCRY